MDKVKGLFNEVKMELLKVAFIYTFLDAVMLFFITYFIISLFNIKFMYTLFLPGAITFVFFAASLISRINKSKLKDMEDANPQLKEMLRTAHDNQDDDNEMIGALFSDLKGKMKTSSSGNLLEPKKITMRIISAVVVVFLIIFFSTITINIKKIDIPFDKLKFMSQNSNLHREGNITDLEFNQTEVIYGDSSIAKLGSDQINIDVKSSLSDIDFDNVKDAENQKLREGGLPQEIGIVPDAFSNQKVLDEAEAAANYSQRISKI